MLGRNALLMGENVPVDFLLAGGGAKGGGGDGSIYGGGGGGGGEVLTGSDILSSGSYPVVVGAGQTSALAASASTFLGRTARAGHAGASGGSGGHGGAAGNGTPGSPGVSGGGSVGGGSGGGAAGDGVTYTPAGVFSSISGVSAQYGHGADGGSNPAQSGAPNTANGGQGHYIAATGSPAGHATGDGGSGVVIIRYSGPQRATGGTVTSAGGDTIHTFTTSGTFTVTG